MLNSAHIICLGSLARNGVRGECSAQNPPTGSKCHKLINLVWFLLKCSEKADLALPWIDNASVERPSQAWRRPLNRIPLLRLLHFWGGLDSLLGMSHWKHGQTLISSSIWSLFTILKMSVTIWYPGRTTKKKNCRKHFGFPHLNVPGICPLRCLHCVNERTSRSITKIGKVISQLKSACHSAQFLW